MLKNLTVGMEPHEFSEAHATNYRIFINEFPHITFFSTDAYLAGVNLANALVPYKDLDINISDNKLSYDPLSISFIVDEKFKSYLEIFDWMVGVANPQGPRRELQDLEPYDIHLAILDNNKQPMITFKYVTARPIALGQVVFNVQDELNTVLTCDVTFAYDYITYERMDIPLSETTGPYVPGA